MTEHRDLQAQVVAMNEALLLGSLRQHELTEAAEALNARLRAEIIERNALEWKEQQQAIKLAELDRRKDEFLAMLGHELRSPLAAIANATQLLGLQGEEPDVHRKARTIIARQIGHLAHLVEDMLDVSRITTGKVQLRRARVAWNDVIERAVATARPDLDEHVHQLDVALSAAPIWLNADAARLEQVVVNLLTNAAKYSPDGSRIGISVEAMHGWSVLRVRDQGVGIAPELLPHVFDLFTQAERTLDRSAGGLGIGLYVVQRLVQLHDGTVSVSSELGRGTEFVIRLPLDIASDPAVPTPPAQLAIAGDLTCRVLVVDDDEDTAEGMAELLKARGHSVRVAHDGPAAIDAALDFRPRVVLMDIGLPMLNGYEVAERMRAQPTLRDIVLVAITGYGQQTDRERTRAAGFDYHLVKPAPYRDIAAILATAAAHAVPDGAEPR